MPASQARKSRLGVSALDIVDSTVEPVAVATEERRELVMVNTRLDPELVESAKRTARLSGSTLSDFVREAIRREVARREKRLARELAEEARRLSEKHGQNAMQT